MTRSPACFSAGMLLARQRGFVDRGRSLEHDAVGRDALARLDDPDMSLWLDLPSTGMTSRRRCARPSRSWAQRSMSFVMASKCLPFGAGLHGLAHGDERQDRACGLRSTAPSCKLCTVSMSIWPEADADLIDGVDAVHDGGAGPVRSANPCSASAATTS